MIVGIGIDAARVSRTAELVSRFGTRFTSRVFTEGERDYCRKRPRPDPSFAARFAAKEAVMKALGSGWGSGVRFREIEVIQGERGAPLIKLRGGAEKRAAGLGVDKIMVSLTHEADMAIAQAVAIGKDREEN